MRNDNGSGKEIVIAIMPLTEKGVSAMIIFDFGKPYRAFPKRRSRKRYIEERVEVAFFISTFSDASGAGEGDGKGRTPKERISCESGLGHTVKNCMTVIYNGWGAIACFG